MRINNLRRIFYMIARILGDVNAAKKGRLGKRVARRAAGRSTGKVLRRLFK